MNAPLHIERTPAGLELLLNRPERRNALSRELVAALLDAVRGAARDSAVHSVVLLGAPPAFCAGLDLGELAAEADGGGRYDARRLVELYEALETLPQPLIVAATGPALAGGAALLALADVVICGQTTAIGYPGIRHGLIAPVIIPSLVRAIGESRARFLLLTGELLGAEQARDWGLAHEVVADGSVLERARHYARLLASYGSAVLETKRLLRRLGASARGEEVAKLVRYVQLTARGAGLVARFRPEEPSGAG